MVVFRFEWFRSGWGFVPGQGLVSVGCFVDLEVLGLYPFVVLVADRDEVVDVGGSVVAVPFLDVVEFAAPHGCAALVASSVADGYGEALGGVAESLVAS